MNPRVNSFPFPVFEDPKKTLISWGPYMRFMGDNAKFVGNLFELQDWPITLTPATGMTAAPTTLSDVARFFQVGKVIYVYAFLQRTLGGAASSVVIITLPVVAKNVRGHGLNVIITNTVTGISGTGLPEAGSTNCLIRRYDGANYNLVTTDITINGFYETE